MTSKLRYLTALGAVLSVSAVLSACGDSVPGNSVAKVGDLSIKKATFDHWMQIAAISSQGVQPGQAAPKPKLPVPPEYTACVADKKKTAPKPAKGQPKQTDKQFKEQCKQEYESYRDQVLQFLIRTKWISYEAAEQGIKVKDSEVFDQFKQQKEQSFPDDKDYREFLKTSGYSEEDLLYRIRIDTLSNKLQEKLRKGTDKVSQAEITKYYNENKERFAQPERRDLRIVLTKTKQRADQAKRALQGGQAFKAVAKRFSIDQASKDQGGVLLAVAKGQQEKALDDAVFKAKKGELTGPIKTQFGYYVFSVQKITKASQQTLKQSQETIKSLLISEKQQKSQEAFTKSFTDQWKSETQCRDGFVVQDCDNAPKPKEGTTTVPPGAVPQQQQQQQVPQTGAPQSGGAQQVPVQPAE